MYLELLLGKFCLQKKNIVVWGKGREERDLLYIDDLVDFVNKAYEKQKTNFEIFNCGYGKSISITKLIKKMIKVSKKKIKIIYDDTKPNIPIFLSVNCIKAKKHLNWKRKTDLETGIYKTYNWAKKNIAK